MESLRHGSYRAHEGSILQRTEMMRRRQSGLSIVIDADSTAHHVQIIVDRLIDYGRASLFGIGSRRLTLIQLVQSAIPLTFLALFASAAVGPLGIGQWRQRRLLPESHRLVRPTRLRKLAKFNPRICCPNGIVLLVDICYVNSKLVGKICEPALRLLATVGQALYLAIQLVLHALLYQRIMRMRPEN